MGDWFEQQKNKLSKTKDDMIDWWNFVSWRHLPYYLTVEPIGFFLYVGSSMMSAVQMYMLKDKVVQVYTPLMAENKTVEEYNEEIQFYMTWANSLRYAANVCAVVFMITFLGAWSDRVGRKFNCMLGSAALGINIMSNVYMSSTWTYWPIWTYIALGPVEGLFGNYGGCFYATQAYLSDLVIDRSELSWRLNVVMLARTIGAMIASALSAAYAQKMGNIAWCSLGNIVLMIPFVYAFFWIYMIPPYLMEDARKQMAVEIAGERERVRTLLETERRISHALSAVSNGQSHIGNGKSMSKSFKLTVDEQTAEPLATEKVKVDYCEIVFMIGRQYKGAYQTFTRKREGYKRMAIWLMTICMYVTNLAGVEAGQISTQYLIFELGWDETKLNWWSTQGLMIGTFGGFLAIWLFKKVFNLRDTTIALLSMLTYGASQIPVAFPSDFNMALSNWLGVLGNLQQPSMAALMVSYVEPEETGRVLVLFAIMLYASVISQSLFLSPVYLWSIKHFFHGFIYLLVAGMFFASCILLIIIHFLVPPEEKVYEVKKIVEVETEKVTGHHLESDDATQKGRAHTLLEDILED